MSDPLVYCPHQSIGERDVVVAIRFDSIEDANVFRRDGYCIDLNHVAGFRVLEAKSDD